MHIIVLSFTLLRQLYFLIWYHRKHSGIRVVFKKMQYIIFIKNSFLVLNCFLYLIFIRHLIPFSMTFKFWPTIWMKPKSVNLNSNAFWTIIGKILQNRTIWAQKVQALAILTKINHRKLLTQIGQNAIFFQIGLCNINVDQLPKRVTSTKIQVGARYDIQLYRLEMAPLLNKY